MKKILATAAVTASLMFGVSTMSFAAGNPFKDVSRAHWDYNSIVTLVDEGIITPDSTGTFKGDKLATRYDFAIMLSNLINKKSEPVVIANPFNDVEPDNPAYDAVINLAGRRIMEGYGDGKFDGDKNINRYEAALIVLRAIESTGNSINTQKSNAFRDVPANHWAYNGVSKLASEDIISGYGDDTFRGNMQITRYELASIIERVGQLFYF